ncbi:MAG: SBBP repeat-containing protein [Candidatus Brocadia sp.]|nr:SBBP repeat-containing protein [Candidatus Brocadia sp.]
MPRWNMVFIVLIVFLLPVFFPKALPASKKEIIQNTKKLRMPFIVNKGQVDERVAFYANTLGGSIFVTKDGEIVYSLPAKNSKSEVLGLEINGRNTEANSCLSVLWPESGRTSLLPSIMRLTQPWTSKDIPFLPFVKRDERGFTSAITNPKTEIKAVALKEELVGAQVKAVLGEHSLVTKVNYFKGNDPSGWKTNIPAYEFVMLGEVYKGIDLKLKAYGNNVEKLFTVKPGADPDQIKIRLSGVQLPENPPPAPASGGQLPAPLSVGDKGGGVTAKSPLGNVVNAQSKEKGIRQTVLKSPSEEGSWQFPLIKEARGLLVNEHGELEVETRLGIVKFTKPIAYQEIDGRKVDVAVEYNLLNPKSEYGFKVAAYDKTRELVIDPLLASTFLGGFGDDIVQSIAIDTDGNVYVSGVTSSSNFPTTAGSYDANLSGSQDAFVSKLDSDLTSLLASAYLGGSGNETGFSLILDSSGNVYVSGATSSANFPTTDGAYDTSLGGGLLGDAFVSKLTGDLTDLLASTYLGGSLIDLAYPVAIDSDDNIYVIGMTSSADFPTTDDAYNTSYNGLQDVFVTKFNGDLTSLLASTFLGGALIEFAYSAALDPEGNIYVAGQTVSANFPITKGAYDKSLGGGALYGDAFVSRLSGDLTSLLASTFLGGSYVDFSYDVAIDTDGDVYVSGATSSLNFPTTKGAYKKSSKGGDEAFISSFDDDLTRLRASTYLGGSSNDYGYSIAIGQEGNIYVAGYTTSSDLPTTRNAYDTSHNGEVDVFVSKFKGNLEKLLASTYFGDYYDDYCYAMTLDSDENICAVGYTTGSTTRKIADRRDENIYEADDTRLFNFTKSLSAYDTSHNGGEDGFISKFDRDLSASTTSDEDGRISGSVIDTEGVPIESAKVKLKGKETKTKMDTSSDADGFFAFEDLGADTYKVTAKKKGYKNAKQTVALEEGGEEEIAIVMEKKGS